MIIIPSIDLKNGACTRLKQGDFNQATTYAITPQKMADKFKQDGARTLHIVDLEGAKNGRVTQFDVIAEIIDIFSATVQVGGGIRSSEDIETLLSLGAKRVVIGTYALSNITQTLSWLEQYGPQTIVLAMDFRLDNGIPYLASNGWQTQTSKSLWQVLSLFENIQHVLCTDIEKDGMLQGPNTTFYQQFLSKFPQIKLQASGGIGQVADFLQLKKIGLAGCIVGKALYENNLSLSETITCLNQE